MLFRRVGLLFRKKPFEIHPFSWDNVLSQFKDVSLGSNLLRTYHWETKKHKLPVLLTYIRLPYPYGIDVEWTDEKDFKIDLLLMEA